MVASRTSSPTALTNAGPPVTAPSFWLVTSTTMPLLLPSSTLGYHFSNTWSAYSKASALLYNQLHHHQYSISKITSTFINIKTQNNFEHTKDHQKEKAKILTVSFLTVMKLMWKFFLDSKSDKSCFKSDFVTLLITPASSTK